VRWLHSACIVAAVLGIGSCSSPKEITRDRTLSSEQVMAMVSQRNNAIQTLIGSGSITIESPEHSFSGGFDLNLRKPDSVRVDFSGPFGIDVGTLMVSREQFIFYNSMDNKAVVGIPDGKTLNAMFNLTMNFDEILGAFTGEFISGDNDSLTRFSVERGEYVLRYQNGNARKEYRINGEAFVLTSLRLFDVETETPRMTALASGIDVADSVAMPMMLRVIFPSERRSITIAYDDIHINRDVDCSYSLPQQADIIYRR
jgi:outer membrane lipoprotein-sorting protein